MSNGSSAKIQSGLMQMQAQRLQQGIIMSPRINGGPEHGGHEVRRPKITKEFVLDEADVSITE